jgi:hypothetical protein
MTMKVVDFGESTHGRIDKVSRYGWTIKDEPGRLCMIDKNRLLIDDNYQREAAHKKVSEITSDWSWIACGALIVAEREDGTLWVIDGQHRLLSAKRRSDITELPCVVFISTGIQTEARGFLDANAKRKPVSAMQKQRALVAIGDEVAIYVSQFVSSCGLIISDNTKLRTSIKYVALLKKYAAHDRASFERVFRFCAAYCLQSDERLHSRLFEGLSYMHRKFAALDDARFAERVNSLHPRKLVDAANRAASLVGHGTEKIYAEGMLLEINKGLRNKFVLEVAE